MPEAKRRARKDEDKAWRRKTILAVAVELWQRHSYADLTMDRMAEAAGLAKGTLYLYFATREHLFLALLEESLAAWFDAVDAGLAAGRGAWSADHAARFLARSLKERQPLVRLLVLLEAVLERNIDLETARRFKRLLLDRLTFTGRLLERRLPWLKPAQGVRLLIHIRALVTGLQQMADTSPVINSVLEQDADLRVFRIDFEREFQMSAAALIRGWDRSKD